MNKVDDFMQMLAQQTAPMQKKEFKDRSKTVEKISLSFNGNWGRYQVLPINNAITDYPFVVLFGTREVAIPRRRNNPDGSVSVDMVWIKILPKMGYIMKDNSGRGYVCSLTADDERVLNEAVQMFDTLYNELDPVNNYDVTRNLLRKRNYTLFHAYCLNKWNFEDSRTPARQNFAGLFVCTAKGFVQFIEDNIRETSLLNGGDNEWISQIYGDNLNDRRGFMLFSINRNKAGNPGFQVTVNHKTGLAPIQVPLTEEELAEMKDPIATFLGWQANHSTDSEPVEQRRLFNPELIKEATNFMAQQLAAIRNAKATGIEMKDAIAATTNKAAQSAPFFGKQMTNDPILQEEANREAAQVAATNKTIVNNNTDPFQTPPAGHFNPLNGAPVADPNPTATPNMGFESGFKTPDFASFGGGMPNNGASNDEELPF